MSKPPLLPDPQRSQWSKFIASFVYAFRGLWYALRTRRNAKVHVTIAIIAIVMGIALHISALEFALVFVAITAVFIAELFNTVFELCIDLASPEYNPIAKVAKDMAAGGVLLSAMLSITIGLFVFGPHVWALLQRVH